MPVTVIRFADCNILSAHHYLLDTSLKNNSVSTNGCLRFSGAYYASHLAL
jgi:hypothetical protein